MPPRLTTKILLLDDEPDFFEAVKDLLIEQIESGKYLLDYAENCNQALKSIEDEPPDLLLLDIALPDRDGFTFLKELKEKNIDIKVIVISGHATRSNLMEAINEKVLKFLPKDFTEEDLENLIEECIGFRQRKVKKTGLRNVLDLAEQLSEKQKYKLVATITSTLSTQLITKLQNELSNFVLEAEIRENELQTKRNRELAAEQARKQKDEQRRREGKVPLSFLEKAYVEVKEDKYLILRWKKTDNNGDRLRSRSIKSKDLEDPEAREIIRERTKKRLSESALMKIFQHYESQPN